MDDRKHVWKERRLGQVDVFGENGHGYYSLDGDDRQGGVVFCFSWLKLSVQTEAERGAMLQRRRGVASLQHSSQSQSRGGVREYGTLRDRGRQ